MRLLYSAERTPLGTGGAVRQALPLLHTPTVLLLNGDSYCDVDFAGLARLPPASVRPRSAWRSARVADTSRFGAVQATPDGRRAALRREAPTGGAGWINAGIYLLARTLLEDIPPGGAASLERQVFPAMARPQHLLCVLLCRPLSGYRHTGIVCRGGGVLSQGQQPPEAPVCREGHAGQPLQSSQTAIGHAVAG